MEARNRLVVRLFVRLAVAACMFIAVACSSTPKFSNSPRIQQVLEVANDLIGTDYCSRGATPDCFDCSGYTSWCYSKVGVALPRTSSEQFTIGESITRKQLRAGDLVFFKTVASTVSHVGICVDANRFIHASTSTGVMISRFDDSYWKSRYLGARRLP